MTKDTDTIAALAAENERLIDEEDFDVIEDL